MARRGGRTAPRKSGMTRSLDTVHRNARFHPLLPTLRNKNTADAVRRPSAEGPRRACGGDVECVRAAAPQASPCPQTCGRGGSCSGAQGPSWPGQGRGRKQSRNPVAGVGGRAGNSAGGWLPGAETHSADAVSPPARGAGFCRSHRDTNTVQHGTRLP